MRRKTIVLNLLFAGAAAGAGVAAYLVTGTSTASTTATLRTTTVQRGSVLSTISSSGNIQAAHSVNLSFTASGTLTGLWVKAGQKVKKGQRLAQVDPTDARQTLRNAQASLASAQASYQSTLQGQTAAQQRQNALSITQAQLQLANARTSLADTRAQQALDAQTQETSVAQARASLATTEQTIALDLQNQATSVANARAALAQAQANVEQSEKSLQTAIAQARTSLAFAKQTAGNGSASQQLQLKQAQTQLATDQAKVNADYGNLQGIVGATDGAKDSVAKAQAALTNDQLQLQKITEYQTANACTATCPAPYDPLSQKQLQFRQTQDQAVLSALNTVSNDLAAIAKDEQSIATLQQQIRSSGTSNTQSVTNAQNQLNSAIANLDKQQLADAQTITNAQNQLKTALANEAAAKLKDAQSLAQAKQTLATALANQRSARVKATQTLHQQQQSLRSAQLGVQSAVIGNEVKATITPTQIAQARASLQQAQAQVANAQESLAATVLRAPFGGTISAVNGLVGTTVGSGGTGNNATAFMTIIDFSRPLVQVGFSESDASKVRLGQPATLTVSALPSVQLAAHVVALDTTSTLVSNVVTYYATLQLDRTDTGVKPGMTVNATVITSKADDVLHVPTAAVRGTGGTGTVTVVDAKGVQSQVTVTTGIQGDDSTAILAGLTEGQTVVAGTASTTSSSTPATTGFPGGGRGLGGGLGGGGATFRIGG